MAIDYFHCALFSTFAGNEVFAIPCRSPFPKFPLNFYPETHFYRHNFSRYEVMAYKRRWRRSAITCIVDGNCERISVQWVCKVAEF